MLIKPQSKIILTTCLTIFILSSFGIFTVKNNALAIDWCDSKDHTQAVCPSHAPIRLQVGLPTLGETCKYEQIYYEGSEEKKKEKTLHCVEGFPQYVKSIYNFFVGIVGLLAVIVIMLGGFQWLTAAGNAQKIAGAKTRIISAYIPPPILQTRIC